MSFSAEINDFVKGFQAGSAVGGDIQDRKMRREKDKLDQEWKEKDFDFEKEKFTASQKENEDKAARARRALEIQEESIREGRKERAEARAEANRRHAENLKLGYARIEGSKKGGYSDGAYIEDDTPVEDDLAEAESGDTSVIGSETEGLMSEAEENQNLEDGGVVGAEEEEAIPTTPPKPKPRPEMASAEPAVNQEGKGDAVVFRENVKPIVKQVLDIASADIKSQNGVAIDPAGPKKSQDRVNLASTEGAATPEEIKAIDAKIDPENKMAPHEKTAARLVHAYNYFAEKGEEEKATKIATAIIAFNKRASQTLGKLAQAAIEKGDLQSGSKLLADAYDQVPDGKRIEAQPTEKGTVLYKVNYDNRTLLNGEATAQQLWQLAGGVANGTEFIKQMGQVAAQAKGGEGGKKFVRYDEAVSGAAQARKQFNDLVKQFNDFDSTQYDTDEEATAAKKALEARVRDAKKASEKAYGIATQIVDKTGRPMDRFTRDFKAAMDTSESALPFDEAEPTAPAETPKDESGWWGKTMPTWLGGDEAAATAPAAEAVPTQPAPAAAPAQAVPAQAVPATSAGKPLPKEMAAKASDAISKGAPREAVIKRLQENGYDTRGL